MSGATFKLTDAYAAFGVRVADGAMTAGGSNPKLLNSATAAFSLFDVGKRVKVEGAAAGGADLDTYISKWISATKVELKDPALTTVAGSDISYVKGVYRLSTLLKSGDVDGNKYVLSYVHRLQLQLASNSPGGKLYVGGPWVTPTNRGYEIEAAGEVDDFVPSVSPLGTSGDWLTSDFANQVVNVYWFDDINETTHA